MPRTRDRKLRYTARKADRYHLYSAAVQTTDSEIAFFSRLFRKQNGRPPVSIREDFCGTALLCCDCTLRDDKARRAVLGALQKLVTLDNDTSTRLALQLRTALLLEITAAEVQAAFARWIRPKDLAQVTLGPNPE